MKLIKNNFWLRGIQISPVLLDCLSALLSNKGALLLKQRALFGEQFDSILSFLLWHTWLQIKTFTKLHFSISSSISWKGISRVWFNDSWFVFHDSGWSFHESYFSRKHLFHESCWVNRTQENDLEICK